MYAIGNINQMTNDELKHFGLHIENKDCKENSDVNLNVDVFIEIAKNSHIKYEYDKERKALICDRILHTPLNYQFNYGFIPNTLSEDNDPIDAVVIMDDELVPGCYINCKLIGVLETSDDAGNDPKLIMVPSYKIDPAYAAYDNINEISKSTRDKIKYFFSHYKDLENKKVVVGEFRDKVEALKIYQESIKRFNKPFVTSDKITNYYSYIRV
jgi:inorganic pyrophosphatase